MTRTFRSLLPTPYTRNMSMSFAEVEKAFFELEPHERCEIISRGILAFESHQPAEDQDAIDTAWKAELDRRVLEIRRGDVELFDVEDVHARIRSRLHERTA